MTADMHTIPMMKVIDVGNMPIQMVTVGTIRVSRKGGIMVSNR